MLVLPLLIIFGFVLHKLAVQKGESPAKWVGRLLGSFFAILFFISIIAVFYLGEEVVESPDAIQKLEPFGVIWIAGLIGIFLILRYKLTGMEDVEYYDEDPDDKELPKKDFSHFR